jgi:hypothetical protein
MLGACSAADTERVAVRQLRSAAAEWALVNREAAARNLPFAYVDGMRRAARDQIRDAATSLRGTQADAAAEAAALQALPADADPTLLARHAARLKKIEDALESA